MTINPSQNFDSYIPIYETVPETWEEGRLFMVEQFRIVSTAINDREIGYFIDQEVISGKKFIPGLDIIQEGGTSQSFRTILRKVIDFGTLPNSMLKSIPHGIIFDANFTLIQLWASATDPTNFKALPIPFVGAAGGSIEIFMDAVNINITTTSSRSTFTRCFVFIEYIQEV